VENSSAFGLEFPTDCGSPTSWRLQKILGKVKIEKKTPHHIAKDAAKKNGRRQKKGTLSKKRLARKETGGKIFHT
jgi:hypothetical protein